MLSNGKSNISWHLHRGSYRARPGQECAPLALSLAHQTKVSAVDITVLSYDFLRNFLSLLNSALRLLLYTKHPNFLSTEHREMYKMLRASGVSVPRVSSSRGYVWYFRSIVGLNTTAKKRGRGVGNPRGSWKEMVVQQNYTVKALSPYLP